MSDTTAIDMSLPKDVQDALAGISTATLTTVLLKKGLRNVWLRGTRPIRDGQPRLVGRAFTLRFCSGSRRSGNAGVLVLADFDPCGH